MALRKLNQLFALSVLAFIAPSISLAIPVVYTSEADWLLDLGGATINTEDFESSPTGAMAIGTTDIGLFDVTIDNNAESQVGVFGGGTINGSNEFHGDIDAGSTTSLDFSSFDVSPMIAFAGDWYSTTTGDLLTMTINSSIIQFDNYLTGTGQGFLGIIDTDGFSNVDFGVESITTFGEFFSLDNVKVATAASVPEPATLSLLALGLLGFGLVRKKT